MDALIVRSIALRGCRMEVSTVCIPYEQISQAKTYYYTAVENISHESCARVLSSQRTAPALLGHRKRCTIYEIMALLACSPIKSASVDHILADSSSL